MSEKRRPSILDPFATSDYTTEEVMKLPWKEQVEVLVGREYVASAERRREIRKDINEFKSQVARDYYVAQVCKTAAIASSAISAFEATHGNFDSAGALAVTTLGLGFAALRTSRRLGKEHLLGRVATRVTSAIKSR